MVVEELWNKGELKMNAKELLAFASKAATQVFKQTGGVIPILHMVDKNNAHIHVHFAAGFEDRDAKQSTSEIMRKAIRETSAQRYALVMEAWTVNEHGDTKLAMEMTSKGLSLENHPDRIEVITIFVEDKNTNECLSRMYQILRPEHGKATLSPPRDFSEAVRGENAGRFNDLFADEI
jgi:hypothetical protein